MAESYKAIYPGNWVTHLNAYPLPNPDFKTNKRNSGDPRDRQQQAVLFMPGWLAVRKVAHAFVDAGGNTSFDLVVGSPDLRPDDKPRADVKGLLIPSGAVVYRAGFRVPPITHQPGYYSSGDRGVIPGGNKASGLSGTAGDQLVLASATPAAKAVGSIAAAAITTSTDTASATDASSVVVAADGTITAGSQLVQTTWDKPVATTADLTLKLYSVAAGGTAAGSAIKSTLLGGVNLVVEVCYLVKEGVVDLDAVHLPGAQYAGYGG
jgi:hypothetical protein